MPAGAPWLRRRSTGVAVPAAASAGADEVGTVPRHGALPSSSRRRRYVANGVSWWRRAGRGHLDRVVQASAASESAPMRLDGRMLVGLTGGIGAGKSVVAARLA